MEVAAETQFPDVALKLAVLGGTGVGEALGTTGSELGQIHTPFGRTSGPILETSLGGVPALLLSRHGPGHLLNPGQIPARANIFALKQLGATHIIATAAVGSLREEYHPRDLVVPDQIIDKTHGRERTFYDRAAVHVEFAEPFCPVLRRILIDAGSSGSASTASVHDGGCYVCMEGPAFSTRAESHMHRLWGGDLIGMTLLPEARLAREAELPYGAVCLVTDYDCWRPRPEGQVLDGDALLEEIIGNLGETTNHAMSLIKRAASLMRERPVELAACPARDALTVGVWSEKGRIDPEEVRRLWPLWGRHFQSPAQGGLSGSAAAGAGRPVSAVD